MASFKRQLSHDEVGVRFNKWRKPVATFGPGEEGMKAQLCRKLGIADLDIASVEWEKATEVTDKVLKMLGAEIAKEASKYKLKIEKFVRQGSAREGLKVCTADEFDMLLQFSIEGLDFEVQPEQDKSGRTSPEFGKLLVRLPTDQLDIHYPKLYTDMAFFKQNGLDYLNSKMLHEKVFTPIIDRASCIITQKLDTSQSFNFNIVRDINPPAVKICTVFSTYNDDDDAIRSEVDDVYNQYQGQSFVQMGARVPLRKLSTDIDIVPALLIRHDKVPDPTEHGATMDCPRYAVFKWVPANHPFSPIRNSPPETIWRMDSSGYEKHVMDVAQGKQEQRYILTAQRVLKAYFIYENKKEAPSQLVTVLRSYFLKQVAFYCILYCTVLNKVPLFGVKEALTIMLHFLQICLEAQHLPHFFHTNPWLCSMFPEYDMGRKPLRFDVFHNISSDELLQAERGLRLHVRPTLEEFTCPLNPVILEIQEKFREFVTQGEYELRKTA